MKEDAEHILDYLVQLGKGDFNKQQEFLEKVLYAYWDKQIRNDAIIPKQSPTDELKRQSYKLAESAGIEDANIAMDIAERFCMSIHDRLLEQKISKGETLKITYQILPTLYDAE